MSWILFAILNPFFYSLTNFIEKYVIEKKLNNPILLTIISGLLTLTIGILVFAVLGFPLLPFSQALLIICSGMLLTFYLIPYFKALALEDASRIVPLFQFAPIIVLFLSSIFLKESLTLKQLIGFCIMLPGGFILGLNKFEKGVFKIRKSFWLMLLSSFLYAGALILFKFVITTGDFWTVVCYEAFGMGAGALVILAIYSRQKNFEREVKKVNLSVLKLLMLNTVIGVTAQICEFTPLMLAPAALVVIVGGIQPFFVLTIGLLLSVIVPRFIHEDIRRSVVILKLISIVLLFLGIYLLT